MTFVDNKGGSMSGSTFALDETQGEVLRVMGSALRLLCRGEQTGNAFSLMECTAPLSVGPPPHRHPWPEAYYVLSGSVRFVVDGREQMVTAGGFLYVPGGMAHGFSGASDEPARLLIFDVPAHAEGFFRDAEREVRALPEDLAKVPVIGTRHGIEFVRP
jgi:quercetin dioxygenase-like cupin family protein